MKQKLESFEGSNVYLKKLEASEKEIDAIKAENKELLENARDAETDRQHAREEADRLRKQLQKLRAEKEAGGSGVNRRGE